MPIGAINTGRKLFTLNRQAAWDGQRSDLSLIREQSLQGKENLSRLAKYASFGILRSSNTQKCTSLRTERQEYIVPQVLQFDD